MDKLLTLEETKHILNVSKSTLQRWDNSGKLVALRTEGGHRRWKQSDINSILQEQKNTRVVTNSLTDYSDQELLNEIKRRLDTLKK